MLPLVCHIAATAFLASKVVCPCDVASRKPNRYPKGMLSGVNVVVALLAQYDGDGLNVVALIFTFGPISGAHFGCDRRPSCGGAYVGVAYWFVRGLLSRAGSGAERG